MDEEELEFCEKNDTELLNDEYFKESVDSAKTIGSISLHLSKWVEFGNISVKEFRYLANRLKDSNIEDLKFKRFLMDDDHLTAILVGLIHSEIKKLTIVHCKFDWDGILELAFVLKRSKIEYLKLFHNSTMGSEAIHILINSLPLSNIATLILGFIEINFRCLKHLANTLTSTKITVLGLQGCCLNDKSIKYLSKKLNNSKIQSLNLANNEMSLGSLKYLADVLEHTAITELNIHGNKIGSTGAKYLANKLAKSVVQNLDIGGNQIKSEGCLAVGNVIHLTQISKLNLEKNEIDPSGMTSLAENLKKSNVKHLNLATNDLGIKGAQILANGMKDSKLEYLNVDFNQLTNIGMGMILDALQFTKITDFDLNCENNEMKGENMKFVTNAFKYFKLKNLNITFPNDKNLVHVFFNELKTLIESDKIDEILPIKNKTNILINFDFNYSYDNGVEYIFDVIKYFNMKKLKLDDICEETWVLSVVKMLIDIKNPISNITTLSLSGHDFEDEVAIILAKNFKHLKLTHLDLHNNEIKNAGVIAIADELTNSQIRYLNLEYNDFNSIGASYLTNVVAKHPVRISLNCRHQNGFSAEDQLVIKNINYMYLKAQLLVRSVNDNSPVKYDKNMIEHLKAYEIFKNVDLLWESEFGKPKYDYHRIDSKIRSKVTRNFLKIIGIVNSDVIISNLLPTEIIIMICSYLKINDVKFN